MGSLPAIDEITISAFHAALAAGTLTCEQLVEQYLRRIALYDKQEQGINAIIAVNPNALEQARRLDRRYRESGLTGPLHGVPVLLKDNCETEEMPTTAGSKSLAGWQTGRDAFITKRLREAGAIILAKTNLHEFAVWGESVSSILGQSYNPYDHTRTPGGSSGGTGAGVAANFGLIGIGTDTINSIRSPSSACSLCGIRPTIGLVSRMGIVPYSLTQDTAGPIARTVADAARVLSVIAGMDPQDPETAACPAQKDYTAGLKADALRGKRIGVLKSFFGKAEENRPVNDTLAQALPLFEKAGAELVSLDEQIDSAGLVSEISVHLYELKTHLGDYLQSFGERAPVHSIDEILASGLYTPDIHENLLTANRLGVGAEGYEERLEKREALREKAIRLLEDNRLDAIVYPHQQQLVCKTGASQQQRNGALASVTGFPAVVVPGGFTPPDADAPIGVPVGLEIFGRPFDEGGLIQIAYAFEQVSHLRRPPV